MDVAVEELLKNAGILGPILVLFGWYIVAKDRQLKAVQILLNEVQEARTHDAQSVVSELMGLNDKWMTALQANTAALNEMRTVITLLRESLNRPPGPPEGS